MADKKDLYYIGFSKGTKHFSFKAMLTTEEYVGVVAYLTEHADAHEAVKDSFYRSDVTYEGLGESLGSILN